MRFAGYRGRHLRPRPRRRGPVVVGTAAAIWVGQCAVAYAGDHVVSKGETLSEIAVRYGTTTGALARANGLNDPNLIVAGTRLTVPAGGASGSSVRATHTIRAGETLWDLAQRFGVSAGSLARANGISNPNFIVAGTSLSVPADGGSSTSAPGPVSATEVGYLLEQEAVANGVNPSLIKAMAYQESGWQQDVVSSAGAIGVMQVMPGTARWVNKVLLGGTSLNVRKAHDNIRMGVSYMRYLLSIMPTQDQALAAYYSGPGNVGSKLRRYQRVYVNAVNAHLTRF
jgi:LysM repeat protein